MARTILKNVRFSYPNIFRPDDEGKYSMQLLIPKDNEQALTAIRTAFDQARKDDGGLTLGKNFMQAPDTLHDGDQPNQNGNERSPECHGCYVMNVKSKFAPKVLVGRDRLEATETDVKPGDWGCVTLNTRAYNTGVNKGVTAYLDAVWKTKDGERLGSSGGSAEDAFASIDANEIDFGDNIDPLTGLPMDDDIPF